MSTKPIAPGVLVMCKRPPNTAFHQFSGTIRTVREVAGVIELPGEARRTTWYLDPPTMVSPHREGMWTAKYLHILDGDQPEETKTKELELA